MPRPKLGPGFAAAQAFLQVPRVASNPEFLERIKKNAKYDKIPERLVVEGATVVCTQMYEDESQSKMKKTDTSNGIMLQGAYELVHTDIEFEPKFEKCRYCDEECCPEIENEEWQEYDETHQSNGGYGLLEDKSFMVCTKGFGVLYISECGQRSKDMKALLMKLGDHALLGKLMYAAFGGDPVNMATGNFIFARTDLEIGGRIPLAFKRFYNTFDDHIGALGKGWTHPYDIKLTQADEGITIRFEDGHEELYKTGGRANEARNKREEKPTKGYRLSKPGEVLADLNEKGYEAPDGNFNQLIKLRSEHRLVKSDGTTLYFNEAGQLTKIQDQDQNETLLTYEDEHLISVTSSTGSFMFTYEADKIAILTDHTGRRVTYTYEGDLLTSATDPLGNIRAYAYDEKGRFLNEINPEGHLIVENEYDEKDRTIKQRYPDGSEMGYVYDEVEKTTEFIAQNGAKTIYHRDDLYRTTEITYPDWGEIQTEFNWKNQKISETDKIGPRTYYDYDEKGNLSRIENPLGEMTALTYDVDNRLKNISVDGKLKLHNEYDKAGNLVAAEDALKRQVRFTYNKGKKGLPTHIAQPDGSVIKLAYDEQGNITEMTNALGVKTHYAYDALNRVIKTTDGNGNETHYRYDLNNNMTEIKNAEENVQTYVYNKANKITMITDFNGSQIKQEYNALNKLSKMIDQLGRVTKLDYDVMWNVSKVTQPNGAEIGFIYDEHNRLVTIQKPDENMIQYEYDLNGNKTKIIDEAGNATFLTYDKLQRLIEVKDDEGVQVSYTYSADGNITSVTDAMEHTIHLAYDEAGQLIQETHALGDSRYYTYTALGKIETVTDEANRVTRYDYEPGGRLKEIHHPDGTSESFTYDANGNIKTHTNQTDQKTTYDYDSLNRMVEILAPNGGKKAYTYDPVDNVTSMSDELGNKTTYEYTLTGQLSKVMDALGNETHYTYDELDQLIEVRQLGGVDGTDGIDADWMQANEHNEANRVTLYKRNLLGQVVAVKDALGQMERYRYSPTGQLIEKIDKDGYLTKYGYTAGGDVNHIQYADGRSVEMSYNPLRQLTEVKDWLGVTSIEVDPLGRPKKVTNHNDEVIEYTFGKGGERRSITYPDGKTVNYAYDEALRLTSIIDGNNQTNYHYDEYSRLIEKQYPNDTSTNYQFNELGQLKQLNHYKEGKSIDQFYYEYDLLGNKTRIKKSRQGFSLEENGSYEYRYDALNRLDRVIKERHILRTYQYDGFNNRVKKSEKGNEVAYTYNSLNQLISSHDTAGVEQKYSYDERGNLTETYKNDQLTHRYHFGALNRLESAFNHEQNIGAFYDYNGFGHRVGGMEGLPTTPVLPTTELHDIYIDSTKQVEDVIDFTRQFHNLIQRKVGYFEPGEEESNNVQTSRFTWDFGVLSSQSKDKTLHYLPDDLGSPIRLMNERGYEREVLDYDEFGKSLRPSFSPQPFTYTGYQLDEISDTLYAQARQYKPELGRFISQDTHWHPGNMIYGDKQTYSEVPLFLHGIIPDALAIGQANNLYGYTMNNPINYIDLEGNAIITGAIVIGALKVFTGGAAIGAGTNVVTQVGSDMLAGESFRDSFNNISLGEVVVHGVGGGVGALIPGSNVLFHGGANAVINVGTYVGAQWVNGEKVTLGGLAWNAGTGAVFGGGGQMWSNHIGSPPAPSIEIGIPYRLRTLGIPNSLWRELSRQVGTWSATETLNFILDEVFENLNSEDECPLG